MKERNATLMKWFLDEETLKTKDWYEVSKLILTLKISFVTIVLNTLLLPTIYAHDKLSFLFNFIAFLGACSIPLLIKFKKFGWIKAALLIAFLGVVNMHFTTNDPHPLGIGAWYIVFILVATFLFGSRFGMIFLGIAMAVCLTVMILSYNDLSLFNYVSPKTKEFPLFPFIRLLFPFTLIFMIVREYQYHRARSESELTQAVDQEKSLKEKIQKNEEKFTQLLDSADDMIYELNGEGFFNYVNPSCIKATGFTNPEFFELTFDTLVHPEYKESHRNFYIKQVRNRIPQTYFEFPIRSKSGDYMWVGQKVRMTFSPKGRMEKALCIARDITPQKQALDDLKVANEASEKARKEAIKASMAKAEFLSAMSHELRTPMNAVVGLTNYLMRQDPRPDQLEMLNTLEFSANNLLSLINDILDFSKIEAGKVDLEEVDFNLHDLIKGVTSSLGTKADDKGIQLNYKYDEKLPNWVKGDPTRLSQILNNLVGNALKFTDAKGQVNLNLRLLEEKAGKHQIYFEVVDTGIGIPEEKLNSIFENFTQAASFTTRKYGGTGLGLSITKKLLEIQHSEIKVKSKEGEGSTFYFTLSLGGSKKNGESKSNVNLRKVEDQKLDGYKVLLVEDNKINQVVAKKFLSMWKMEIDVAENGLIAVEAVQKKDFDIILMDLQMPEMDGFEATKMIRSLGGTYEDLPILALTASAVLEIKSKAFEVGMDDYIMKPFDPDQLFRKIKYYCTPVDKRMTA